MISDRSAKYLWDARRAADRIVRFVANRNFDSYETDEMLRAAVERQFEIIGEAFAGLRNSDPELAAEIPELPHIVAFRNMLIHGYATVDHRRVWGVIEAQLPGLRAALEVLLGDMP